MLHAMVYCDSAEHVQTLMNRGADPRAHAPTDVALQTRRVVTKRRGGFKKSKQYVESFVEQYAAGITPLELSVKVATPQIEIILREVGVKAFGFISLEVCGLGLDFGVGH